MKFQNSPKFDKRSEWNQIWESFISDIPLPDKIICNVLKQFFSVDRKRAILTSLHLVRLYCVNTNVQMTECSCECSLYTLQKMYMRYTFENTSLIISIECSVTYWAWKNRMIYPALGRITERLRTSHHSFWVFSLNFFVSISRLSAEFKLWGSSSYEKFNLFINSW